MLKPHIFVIEDDPDMVRTASLFLEEEGYRVSAYENPVNGLLKAKETPPDLLLLDLNMPGLDGYSVIKSLRSDPKTHHVPIIMVSVKSEESTVVVALELGANDFVSKPFRKRELAARIKTALRQNETEKPPSTIEKGPFKIDQAAFRASANGKEIDFTPKEFQLFAFLLQNEGRVVTRQTISQSVWGVEHFKSMQTIEFHMHQLRKKLGPYGLFIKGLKGIGYRFEIADS